LLAWAPKIYACAHLGAQPVVLVRGFEAIPRRGSEPMADWICPSCHAQIAASEDRCWCGAERPPQEAIGRAPELSLPPGFRRITVGGEVQIHESRDIGSPVISAVKRMDKLFLGLHSRDANGQKWIEAQTVQGARGFVQKSKAVWEPRPAFIIGVLGGVAVLVGGSAYWIIESGVSISKLAMIALGTYGAFAVGSRLKRR